jgi:hypothetical protein
MGAVIAGLVVIILWLTIIISWVGNVIKLTDCDFASPYKCEVVHGVGIIPLASVVTVWLGTDEIEVIK